MAELIGIHVETDRLKFVLREMRPLLAENPDLATKLEAMIEGGEIITTRPLPGFEAEAGVLVLQACFTPEARRMIREMSLVADTLLVANGFGDV